MKRVIFIIALLFLVGCSSNNSLISNKKSLLLDKNWKEGGSPFSDSAICTLKISAVTELEEERISGELNIDENFTALTFIGLNTENPVMVGNLGDKSSLAKIDNGSTIYLIEQTVLGGLNIFTFFRDKNVMILSKQYSLLGKPFGLMMIGDCVSGI